MGMLSWLNTAAFSRYFGKMTTTLMQINTTKIVHIIIYHVSEE